MKKRLAGFLNKSNAGESICFDLAFTLAFHRKLLLKVENVG